MKITGKIIDVLEELSGIAKKSGNKYKIARYILETSGQYPQKVFFEVFGNTNINSFDIKKGENVTILCDIDAHEYNGKWYNQISVLDVERPTDTPPCQIPPRPEIKGFWVSDDLEEPPF